MGWGRETSSLEHLGAEGPGVASLRVWDAPALRIGKYLQEGLAEPGLLWRPLTKTMTPSQESCYVAGAEALPTT